MKKFLTLLLLCASAHAAGFHVLNGKLYDATNQEFRIRGVNRNHWDSDSAAGIGKSGANAVRWVLDFTRDPALNAGLLQAQSLAYKNIPIAGNWTATCSSDPTVVAAAVATWVSQASQWTALNSTMILNIANEWGPSNSTIWRDSYISAIQALRTAGYTGVLLVDSGGCGQDDQDLLLYSQAVFAADPLKNTMFALHLYGGTNDLTAQIKSIARGNPTVVTLASTAATHPFAPTYDGTNNNYSGLTAYNLTGVPGGSGMQSAPQNVGGVPGAWTVTLSVDSTGWPAYTSGGSLVDYWGNYALKIGRLAALGKQTGAAYIIGEFGPGRNIGPSPTLVTPAEILTTAEADGVGWLAWAWDDNNLANCSADDLWFDMQYGCGEYTSAANLTIFGKDVVLSPVYGLSVIARPAGIFASPAPVAPGGFSVK